ncbi:hypothetical protein C3F09_08195 [candidate division GN15 bacterium]|uniref:Uncharacterized protein n=1 Tax=candidate division GN15 bacterium TaxID=2072418 RepID=A0A855X2T3_9BACT|nr:MAG: hypothetical protein C3F09_08195 [candidate division GN15 bacterium]
MNAAHGRLKTLVVFDHWSWLLFVAWFTVATVLNALGSSAGAAVTYWGIVAVLVDNVMRLVLLAAHFELEKKSTYLGLTVVLILAMIASILFQLWVH